MKKNKIKLAMTDEISADFCRAVRRAANLWNDQDARAALNVLERGVVKKIEKLDGHMAHKFREFFWKQRLVGSPEERVLCAMLFAPFRNLPDTYDPANPPLTNSGTLAEYREMRRTMLLGMKLAVDVVFDSMLEEVDGDEWSPALSKRQLATVIRAVVDEYKCADGNDARLFDEAMRKHGIDHFPAKGKGEGEHVNVSELHRAFPEFEERELHLLRRRMSDPEIWDALGVPPDDLRRRT